MFRNRLIALALSSLLAMAGGALPARASQNSIVMPATGPMSMATFVTTYLNPAFLSLGSCWSGGTPPAGGPGSAAIVYQCWWDTSTNPKVLRYWDGTNWVGSGSLDTSAHAFSISIAETVSAQVGTSYTIADSNRGQLLTQSNAGPSAWALPQAGAGSAFLAGWFADVRNLGTGTLTITPATSTIDGASTLVLTQGAGARIVSDGTNFYTVKVPGLPTTAVLGGAFAKAAVTSNWLRSLGTDGNFTASQPACADVSDATTFCNGTNAANLTGTVGSARLSGSYTGITGVGTLAAGATGAGFTIDLSTSTVSNTLPAANLGALTGDVTKSSGNNTTTLANIPTATPMAGSVLATNIAAPSTPASGKTSVYIDSTAKVLATKNDAGTVSVTVVPDTGASNNFLTAISSAGVISKARPACTNLSDASPSCNTDATNAGNISAGTLPAGRLPAFSGDVTTSAGSSVTTLANIPTGTTAAGSILHSNIAAPSTPASTKVSVWTDSTDLRFHDKNSAGTIATTVVADTGASNNYISAISAAGVITKSRPACATLSDSSPFCNGTGASNLTGTLAAGQFPALTGDVTTSAGSLATAIGATVVHSSMLNSDVYSTAHSWGGPQTLAAPITTGLEDHQGAQKYSTQSAPAQITSDQNNYNPSSVVCSTSSTLLINSDAARNITGVAGGVIGCDLYLINNGSFTITLKEQNASSTAANRFNTGGDIALLAAGGIHLRYDNTASRWRLVGTSSGGGGGGGSGTVTSIACDNGIDCATITNSGTVKGSFRHNMLLPL